MVDILDKNFVLAEDLCADVSPAVPDTDQTDAPKNTQVGRRDFLKYFSASAALAAGSCVRRPAEYAIPYVNQPVDQVPGVATYYASTCGGCAAGCGMTVKTREGRPVKVEGNSKQQISGGALCSLGQASLQGLYHPERRPTPLIMRNGKHTSVSWDDVYLHLADKLQGRAVGIFTNGATGHRHAFLQEVLQKLGAKDTHLYTYEANMLYTHIANAHHKAFSRRVIPRANFEQAGMVLGIGTDFLDNGVAKVYYARSFANARDVRRSNNYMEFVQFESAFSLTGASADKRVVIAPNSEIDTAVVLARTLLKHPKARGGEAEHQIIGAMLQKLQRQANIDESVQSEINRLVPKLFAKPSLILCGGSAFDVNSEALQSVTIAINILLGAYDTLLDMQEQWHVPPVRGDDLQRFSKEVKNLEALFVIDSDPYFTLPASWGFADKTKHLPYLISMNSFPTVTDEHATHVLPTHHFLESWGDEQALAGEWTLRQPTVRQITDSRQSEDILLWLLATMQKSLPYADYRSYLRKRWQALHDLAGGKGQFADFMHKHLERGVFVHHNKRVRGELRAVAVQMQKVAKGMKLSAPLDYRLQDGRGAHLPVLQEVGDSLTTVAWDTWVAMSVATAKRLGFKRNDLLQIKGAGGTIEAPLYPMPGVHDDAVIVPRGNGFLSVSPEKGKQMSNVSAGIGVNPLPAFAGIGVLPLTSGESVSVVRTGKTQRLVVMQKESQLGERGDIVKRISLANATKHQGETKNLDSVPDLYPKLEEAEYRWGMSIDLQKCIGCSACMVACSQENNVPQVGRSQVAMGREMHWLRLDRYFTGDLHNPQVTIQPMMCQQCNHAPCEAVCPVYATTHDAEGINAMTYNRCVGTRYCANACPYKVRRFNWWTHKWNVIDEKDYNRNPRALNPDVSVRTRGVMEKCNFCYQRLRDAKHQVKQEQRPLRDGELKTACQQTCPTEAITFGNLHDKTSEVAKQREDYRAYLALGGYPELGEYGLKTLPNVSYLAKITLQEKGETHEQH